MDLGQLITTFLGGGIISAIFTYLLNKRKVRAEAERISAETEISLTQTLGQEYRQIVNGLKDEIVKLNSKLEKQGAIIEKQGVTIKEQGLRIGELEKEARKWEWKYKTLKNKK